MAECYYGNIIERFLFNYTNPTQPLPDDRVEAAFATIVGTKQRRFGCMPPENVQEALRDIIWGSRDHIRFFLPWGSRKQVKGDSLDIMEFMALKQLACLQDELESLGYTSSFHIRIEDITDYWLFHDDPVSNQLTDEYAETLCSLGKLLLKPGTWFPVKETSLITKEQFCKQARENQPLFTMLLEDGSGASYARQELRQLGWESSVPQEQREYFIRQYAKYYPEEDGVCKLAQYFSSALARTQLKAVAWPEAPFIFITFGHPIPGNPYAPNRIFYRTIPQKFTNNHRSPWLAKGYMQIDRDDNICPKSLEYGEQPRELVNLQMEVNDIPVCADYLLTDSHPLLGYKFHLDTTQHHTCGSGD